MRVLVTGGSGFLGRSIIAALRAAGHRPVALARSPAAARTVEAAGAQPAEGDLAPPAGLGAALAGCDAVVHAAGIVRLWGHAAEMRALHVGGTAALLAAARAAGVARFVHIGAASVLCDGRPVRGADETTPLPPRAAGAYSQTKAEAEALVVAADAPGFTTIALRPPFIWGPGNPALPPIAARVRAGRWLWIDRGDYPYATAHAANVAAAAVAALARGGGGRAYFVTDGGTRTFRTFMTDLLRGEGLTPQARSVPGWAARASAAGTKKA